MNDLVGYIAAIGSTTRESGAVIGNGMKTIISRITTMGEAKDALQEVNISIKDMEGNVKPVSSILEELAGKWTSLSDEQRQNLSVTLAGRYQLSRFAALMNNFSMAQDATATAVNSSGSAMREQEKYAGSLEARINRLDTAWNKFTLALGDAVLTDGLIASIEILNSITSTAADNMGVMGASAGLLGGALTMLSTRFRIFTTSLIFGSAEMTRAQLASAGLTAGMGRLGIAIVGVRTALMGLAAATVVGVIFVGLGIAIEKLITAYSNAKQKQEEFEAAQVKNIDAITNNKEKTEELIDAYKKLSQEKENGNWNTEKEKEYLQIQQQLGDIFPSLVSHIDATGQAHLISSDAINQEIEATKELIELKKEETRLKAVENFENAISERDKIQEDIDARKADIENLKSYNDSWMATKGETQKHKETINQLKQEILGMESQFANSSMKINDDVLKTSEAFNRLEIDPQIKQSIDEFISSLDFSSLNASELDAYSKKIAQTSDELQKAYDSGDRGGFNAAKDSLKEYAQEFGATDLQAKSLNFTLDGVKQKNEELANATYAGRDGTEGLADSEYDLANAANSATGAIDGETGALSGNTDAKFDNVSASSILFGITEDQIKQMENAIMVVSMLSGQEGLNAEQKGLLAQATGFLASMYPHLNGQISENIGWIQSQIGMMSSLNQASGGNAAVMMANQDNITKASVAAVNQRIMAYQTEIAALNRTYNAAIKMANDFEQATGEPAPFKAGIISVRNRLSDAQLGLARANETKLGAIYGSGVKTGAIKPYNGSGGGSSGRGSGGSGKSKGSSSGSDREIEQYLTDKYAQAVDNLNTKLDESEYRSSRMEKTSKEYRKELNNQISIQQQLKKLASDEQKRLESRNASLNRSLKSMGNYNKLSDKQKEKYNDIASEIDDNISKINDLKSAYVNANRAIDSALDDLKDAYNQVADEIIDTYKEAYEKQRDVAIDALDKEIEAFEKAHQDKMDMLQEEMSAYEEIIQAQIDAIDKEEDNNGYDKELAKKQKEQQDIVNKMNILALDDSVEARNRYAELQKQLAEKNLEIEEYVHDREVQLRKDALNQQLEDRRDYIEGIKELEDQEYEKGKEEYDAERESVNRYWENLLNDERKWAKLRGEVMKGSINAIDLDMLNFATSVSEHMKTIGESITQNLLDKIKEVRGMLGEIGGSPLPPSSSNSSKPIAQMATGGMTPKWGSGGKLAVLHQEELLLNKDETKGFFKSIDVLKGVTGVLQKFSKSINLPSLKQPSVPNQVNISMPMTIENLHATKDGGNEFMKTINKGLKETGFVLDIR